MSQINSQITLTDKMSGKLLSIANSLNSVIAGMQQVDVATDRGFDTVPIVQSNVAITENIQANKQLGKQINENEKEQKEFNEQVQKSTNVFGGLIGKVGMLVTAYAGFQTIKSAITYASDLAEVQNVVDVSFGNSANQINEWSKSTLNAYGLNEVSAKRYAGTMGAMLKSSGLTGDSVTEMSMRITELAGDMASFYNLNPEEAFTKIRSGISGETEPLKQLGINMNVANLEAFALSQGITKAYNSMSQAEQVMLRYNYLMKVSADSQGDFTRTSGSFANQSKLLKENWQQFIGTLANGVLPVLASTLVFLNAIVIGVQDNWTIIKPIAISLLSIISAYVVALGIYKAITLATAIAEGVRTLATVASTGATFAATASQYGFNTALMACPITWIVLAIIAFIGVLFALAEAMAKTTKTAQTGFGIIAGTTAFVCAYIWNLILGLINYVIQYGVELYNLIGSFANFFANVFNKPVESIIGLFLDVFNCIVGVVEGAAGLIDMLLGSNISGAIKGFRNQIEDFKNSVVGEQVEVMAKVDANDYKLKRVNPEEWYKAGANFGDSFTKKAQDVLNGGAFGGLGDIGDNTNEIANNTSDISNSLNTTSEDLKYLRDIAERDVINRFTTAEIKVDMTNNNNISNSMDIDGVVDLLAYKVNEAMEIASEGVY